MTSCPAGPAGSLNVKPPATPGPPRGVQAPMLPGSQPAYTGAEPTAVGVTTGAGGAVVSTVNVHHGDHGDVSWLSLVCTRNWYCLPSAAAPRVTVTAPLLLAGLVGPERVVTVPDGSCCHWNVEDR